MSLPTFSMRQLIEAGCHFGHNTRRWNPKMDTYLYGVRDGIHIIDLQQTVPLLHRAMQAVHDAVAGGGRVLFVGTKRQATDLVKEYAERCGQYYVNHRWLGGTLTNWKTISRSIKRLKDLEERFANEEGMSGLTKKEQLHLERERTKLDQALGGIKDMGALPDLIFIVDTNKEDIAVAEANKLNIPVAGVLDSNSNPKGIDYPIPGNDDAIRALKLYLELMANAALEGIQDEMTAAGVDVGAQEKAPAEKLAPAESKLAEKVKDWAPKAKAAADSKPDPVSKAAPEAVVEPVPEPVPEPITVVMEEPAAEKVLEAAIAKASTISEGKDQDKAEPAKPQQKQEKQEQPAKADPVDKKTAPKKAKTEDKKPAPKKAEPKKPVAKKVAPAKKPAAKKKAPTTKKKATTAKKTTAKKAAAKKK